MADDQTHPNLDSKLNMIKPIQMVSMLQTFSKLEDAQAHRANLKYKDQYGILELYNKKGNSLYACVLERVLDAIMDWHETDETETIS